MIKQILVSFSNNLLLGLIFLCLSPSPVFSAETDNAIELEAPVPRRLLEEGKRLAKRTASSKNMWQAAVKFCSASRMGSTEAQYQLAMLYAFGQGVPQRRAHAAALFATAAQQGHFESQRMLETLQFESAELPACVLTEGQLPEKSKYRSSANIAFDTIDLETRIKHLPANKSWLVQMVKTMAPWYQVDARLALSIISVESNFETDARSNKNAMGVMQLIPATAERFNVKDAFNASQNIKAGLSYLRWLLSRYNNDVALAAAGYNAGEGAVDRYHGVPPYPETQQYVQKVLNLYRHERHAVTKESIAKSDVATID